MSRFERVIPARSVSPGLTLLKLEFSPGTIRLCGSNMDLDLEATLAADVESKGEAALPAQLLARVVKSAPGDMLDLEVSHSELTVRSDSFESSLQLVEAASAPAISFPSSFDGALPAESVAQLLSRVRYAAATTASRAVFRGVKVEFKSASTRAVATDGFRLAYYEVEEASGLEGEIVIPSRTVDDLVRILGGGEARLKIGEGQLSLAANGTRINAKLLEGSYPDYASVIPSHFPVHITLERNHLADAIARVSSVVESANNDRIDLFIKDGLLQIVAEGDYGRAHEQLTVKQEGTESEIAAQYNPRYLSEALRSVAGPIRLSLSGTESPSVLQGVNDKGYLAMVVPLSSA